jgi:ribosomal protein S19E (S16A)
MSSKRFRLSFRKYDIVAQTIKAYCHAYKLKNEAVTIQEVINAGGPKRNIISQIVGFLVDIGILQEAKKRKRSPTPEGEELGQALLRGSTEEERIYWYKVVWANDFLSERIIPALQIESKNREEITKLILENAGSNLKRKSDAERGAQVVIEIMEKAGVIEAKADGRFIVCEEMPDSSAAGQLIPLGIVQGTRGYIEEIAKQANGCYDNDCYDACAVMIRRFIETLIIECFESRNTEAKIKKSDGNYLYLSDLIRRFLEEQSWIPTRNTKASLPELKTIGDLSAHSRYYLAKRSDIDRVKPDIRVVAQELISIAKLNENRKS